MSSEITVARVQQFNSNVMMLSQQQGTRLEPLVRNEVQKSKAAFYDRIGKVAAQTRSGRHSPTPQMDTPHSRRMVSLIDKEWGDVIDEQDKLRMLWDPTSHYVMAAGWALGRSKDVEIAAQALGSAFGGESGTSAIVLPDIQKYAANDGTSFSNLNVITLRAVKKMMDQKEVEGKRYVVCSSSQIDSLLSLTQVTSSDYANVKALVMGEVDSYLGFKFIRIESPIIGVTTALSGTAATGVVQTTAGLTSFSGVNRAAFAFAEQGLLFAKGENVATEIAKDPGLSFSTRVYARMSIGATRLEEEQVVEIICKES